MDWVYGMTQTSDSLSWGIYYLRAIGGFAIVFFIPGFTWTLVIFRELHIMERIVLSFGLSIAIVALIVLASNRVMGVSITAANTLISITAIISIALLLYALRKFQESRARN